MIKIDKILVPTDFSETASRAVNHAGLLAKAFGAKLTLLHVLDVAHALQEMMEEPGEEIDMEPHPKQWYKRLRDYADQRIEETAKTDYVCKAPECRTEVLKGENAAAAIAGYAKENEIDLIVIGTHGRTGISKWFFGSTAERVMRIAPCPVLTIAPGAELHPGEEVFDHILFPFDLSDASKHALRYACAFAEKYKAKLELLHVVEYRNLPESYSIRGKEIFEQVTDLEQRVLDEMEREVNKLYEGGRTLNAQFVVEEGKPFEQIVDFADKNKANLIVMGNTGINDTHGQRLGSTAENVVPRAECPVLVVNSKIHEFLE